MGLGFRVQGLGLPVERLALEYYNGYYQGYSALWLKGSSGFGLGFRGESLRMPLDGVILRCATSLKELRLKYGGPFCLSWVRMRKVPAAESMTSPLVGMLLRPMNLIQLPSNPSEAHVLGPFYYTTIRFMAAWSSAPAALTLGWRSVLMPQLLTGEISRFSSVPLIKHSCIDCRHRNKSLRRAHRLKSSRAS